jgi:hypothetical protein
MSIAHLPILSLGTAAAALFVVRAEEPRYAVADGTVLVRSYHSTTKLDSEPCQLSLGGKPVPSAEHPEMRLSVVDDRTLEFTDTIAKVADGRPVKFVRAFDELENDGSETMSLVLPDGKEDKKGSDRERRSELAGRKVVFTWDSEKKEYAKAWDGEGGDDELLEKLEADVDWLGLLPGKAVEKGDSWSLDPKLFVSLQLPGGNLHWKVEGKEPDPVSESINSQLSENMDGESKATWQGRREVDGKELGVIAIEADLTTQGKAGSDDGREERSMELEVEYEGEVLWDMDGGHIAGFTFEGKVHALMSIERPLPTPQGEVPLRQEFDLSGTSKHELEVTAPK